jgi:two-component system, LytTR family, sensor kinase
MMEAIENHNQIGETSIKFSWKSVGIAFAVWTILGLSFASESYLRNYKAGRILPVYIFVIEFLTEFYLYALFSLLVFKIGKKFPLEFKVSVGRFCGNAFIHLAASIIFSMVNVFLGAFIASLWEGELCQDCLTFNMILDPHFLHRGVIVYWGIVIVGQGIDYFRGFNNEKLRVAQLSSQLSEAQLSALKMQIHPHFLFNTLNSIVGLIQEDKHSAELMTTKLSDFLRMTLQNAGEPMVTLKQEFYFLKTYLDIEKVRFQERLTAEFIYDEKILSAKIPNLILQPLVENSIKHGISRKKENGRIEISALRSENRLILQVEDNGNHSEKKSNGFLTSNGNGLGLQNTEARLRQIYGENFSFKITKDNETGTFVMINIPFEV